MPSVPTAPALIARPLAKPSQEMDDARRPGLLGVKAGVRVGIGVSVRCAQAGSA